MSKESLPLRLGVVGAGAVGQMHIQNFIGVPGAQIVAIADLRPDLLAQVAAKFKVAHTYDSHKKLLESADIDGVIVVTRRDQTASVVFDCLSAGRHVFSEKPIAKTIEQAAKLAETANSLNLHYTIGYQRRHDTGTQAAKKLIDDCVKSNELGRICLVNSWNFTGKDRNQEADTVMTSEPRPAGLKNWEQTPGWLNASSANSYDRFVNVFCHDTNILRYFFGEPNAVLYANLENINGQIFVLGYDGFCVNFSGGMAELNKWDDRGEWFEGFEIVFEKGRIRVDLPPPLIHSRSARVQIRRRNQPLEVVSDGQNQVSAFRNQAIAFVSDIRGSRSALNSGADAVRDLELTAKIWRKFLEIE